MHAFPPEILKNVIYWKNTNYTSVQKKLIFVPKTKFSYTVDSIDISSSVQGGFSETITEMYSHEHSLREISDTLNIGKSTEWESLQKKCGATDTQRLRQRKTYVGVHPYGFTVILGQRHPDPKEQKVVKIILSRWHSGKSFCAIAHELNGKRIRPRISKVRDHSTIRSIINHHKDKK